MAVLLTKRPVREVEIRLVLAQGPSLGNTNKLSGATRFPRNCRKKDLGIGLESQLFTL